MTTKNTFFLHEENTHHHKYLDQISEWERRRPYSTMETIFEYNKTTLQDDLKKANDKLNELTVAEDEGERIRLDMKAALRSTIQNLQERIDEYGDKTMTRIDGLLKSNDKISTHKVPDEYPVGYALMEPEDRVGQGATDQEDHIFGIFTMNRFFFKCKGTITGREQPSDFMSISYRDIFPGTNDPRIKLSETDNQSHVYDGECYVGGFTQFGKITRGGKDLGRIDEKFGFVNLSPREK